MHAFWTAAAVARRRRDLRRIGVLSGRLRRVRGRRRRQHREREGRPGEQGRGAKHDRPPHEHRVHRQAGHGSGERAARAGERDRAEQQRERRAPEDARGPAPGSESKVKRQRRSEGEHHRCHVRASAESLVTRRRNRRRGLERAVVVEGEQEQTADGDRDRAEREPFEHELGRLGPGQRNGDDEHDPERGCSPQRQAGRGRPERRRWPRRSRAQAAMSGGRKRLRPRPRPPRVGDGQAPRARAAPPTAACVRRPSHCEDRAGGEQHRHDGGRERELDRPPELHAPEELQQGGRRILSSCERSLSHPERIVPDETEPGIVALHLKRYEFARPYCVGKRRARRRLRRGLRQRVSRRVRTQRRRRRRRAERRSTTRARDTAAANVEFAVGDLQQLERGDAEFDAVVAFEVIEHLPHPERFVAEAAPRV